jgi:tRNA dimethylallyltransferase
MRAVSAAPVPCLVGPTGSGKSDVGIVAARRTGGEVVCCDAYTVYRGMPILTAAPNAPGDVPHRLLGIVGPDQTYDAARFLTDCDYEVDQIRGRGGTPWVVGGTALYLRCWLKGFGTEVPADIAYRAELKALVAAEGPEVLHAELAKVDPERASELHPNDVRRVVRALEIVRATGRPASAQRLEWSGPDRVAACVVGLRRGQEDLDARIAKRTAAMFTAGVVEEARELLRFELSPQAGKVLGLEELRRVLAGEIGEEEAAEAMARRTRRFARKQMTFFNSFDALTWIDVAPDEDAAAIAERVLEVVTAAPDV